MFVDKLNTTTKLKCQILDVGCGKGYAGDILKQLGFFRLTGIDMSNSLLSIAREKKSYELLEKIAFGMEDFVVPEHHIGKYDFVISASMINNDGFDEEIFKHKQGFSIFR